MANVVSTTIELLSQSGSHPFVAVLVVKREYETQQFGSRQTQAIEQYNLQLTAPDLRLIRDKLTILLEHL